MKPKQTNISHLEKSEKGTNLALKFKISKQQISDIRKNKEKILKFSDSVECRIENTAFKGFSSTPLPL